MAGCFEILQAKRWLEGGRRLGVGAECKHTEFSIATRNKIIDWLTGRVKRMLNVVSSRAIADFPTFFRMM